MSTFLDGPARGRNLTLRRAPIFLRVVFAPGGAVDALDQLDDEPREDEAIVVYRRVSTPTVMFIDTWQADGTLTGRRYESADYRLVPTDDNETVRDRDAWRAWCRAHAPAGSIDPTTTNA